MTHARRATTRLERQAVRSLGPVSCACYQTSTLGLSTRSSAWALDALSQERGKTHLGGGFALRCFQRFSFLDVALQPWGGHPNWHTSGRAISVLSSWRCRPSIFLRPRRIETELSRDVLNPARVPLSWATSPTLGTYFRPRMRRADIEVPNPAVDVNSWARSACYPRGSFCPLSHTPSTQECGITKPDFRPCAARQPYSQAPFCLCTLHG